MFFISKNLIPVFAVAVFLAGSAVQAQESTIEIKLGSSQTESMKNFLREHRQDLRKSDSDRSAVVKEFRENINNIKLEQSRILKVTRKYKPPVITERRIFQNKKIFSSPPAPSSVPENISIKPKTIEPRKKPREKEILLNLNERQRRADTETARREKIIRAQNSDFGRLKVEMESDPLKSYQLKLTQFSDKTRDLLEQLQGEQGVPRTVFLDLGNTYLESHRYLNTLSAEDRWKLTRYAPHSGTILGSYESALWVLKMALTRNPNDGETNYLIGKILSEMGERDLALRRARNAEQLFIKNSQPDKIAQAQSLIKSLENSLPQ